MSPNKKFASSEHRPILVANAKEVARWAAGARRQSGGPVPTMNDVLLAALGGGIRRYLELHHDPTVANSGKINMRAISIVNMRAVSGLAKDSKALLNDVKAARWGNDFSYFIIPLPCNHMLNRGLLNGRLISISLLRSRKFRIHAKVLASCWCVNCL